MKKRGLEDEDDEIDSNAVSGGSDAISGLDGETSSSFVPPAKRIFIQRSISPSNAMADEEDDSLPELLKDKVLSFQKQAIWLQMNEYKRLYQDNESQVEQLQSQLKSRESVAELLSSYISSLSQIVSSMIANDTQTPSNDSSLVKLFDQDTRFLEDSLKNTLETIQNGLLAIMETSGGQAGSVDIPQLQSLTVQNTNLRARTEKLSSRISHLEEKLKESNSRVMKMEKKMDRLKLERSASSASLNQNLAESAMESSVAAPTTDGDVSMVPEIKLIEAEKIAESRLSEIGQLNNDLTAMQQEMTRLHIQMEEERLSHSVASFADLEKQLDYRVKEHKRMQVALDTAVSELQFLKEERRLFLDQVKTNEMKERKLLEDTIKKLEADLQRVRSNRDAIQKSLEGKKAQEENLRKSYSELKALTSTRKDMIQCLQADVTRLKSAIACEMGEKALLEFFQESGENPYASLRSQLESLQKESRSLEDQLVAARSALPSEANDVTAVYAQWDETRSQLQADLEKYRKIFGDVGSLAPDVATQLKQMKSSIDDLDMKLEYHRKTESALMAEIETIGKAWADLEKQCASQIETIQEKEEHIHRLLAEKAKYEQKFATLSKQNAALNGTCSALKKQSDRQLEQIRRLEETERNLSQQLQVLSRDNATQDPQLEKEKQYSAELKDKLEQMSHQCHQLTLKADHITQVMKSKTDHAEQEADLRRRAQETADVLKRKVEFLTSKEAPADAMLQKQLEEYRLLLKCQSCNTNFKSHTLLKCMHTFCKSCIDDMYSSRQRKCPACGVAFGLQDIKQVYL